jgi:hypothetical protein
MANLWVTNREQMRNALLVAKETKALVCAIRASHEQGADSLLDKWESESNALIASFEYFLFGDVHPAYRYQAEINGPELHMADIKKIMLNIFDIDIEPLRSQLVVDMPQEEVQKPQVQEPVQTALF